MGEALFGKEPVPSVFHQFLVRRAPHKTTLLEEVAFAQEIHIQAAGRSATFDAISPESIVTDLRRLPQDDQDRPLDSAKGISVDWLLDVFFQLPFLQRLAAIGCQLWFVRKVCVNELLRRYDIHAGPLVDHVDTLHDAAIQNLDSQRRRQQQQQQQLVRHTATVFVSYTGRCLLSHLVDLLEQLRGEYIWFDVFCVDQFAWTGRRASAQVDEYRRQLIGNLSTQIAKIGRVVLLLEKWDDTMYTLRQAWVLWELFNAANVTGVDFTILMPQEEREKFLDSLVHDFRRIQIALSDIQCEKAASEDEEARKQIVQIMATMGYDSVNKMVIEQVRSLYQQIAHAHVETLDNNNSNNNGNDDTQDAAFRNSFASMLHSQGKLDEAEPLYLAALDLLRQVLGRHHPKTIDCINNLGNLRRDQGRLDLAEPLYLETLKLRRRVLGDGHPDTVMSINNVALLRNDQGRYDDAEPLYLQVLAAHRELHGNGHSHTLKVINNLANLRKSQGRLDEAEPLYLESLDIRRNVLGNRHLETLNSINNLANLRRAQGQLDQAELLYVEALEVRRDVLGNQHPDTLWSISNLASLRKEQGQLDVADALYVEALEGFRQRMGNQHRDTLLLMYNLANLRMVQGASAMDQGALAVRRLAEAEALYIEALYTQRAILGHQHSETLDTATNLAKLRLLQGRLGAYLEILASLGPALDEQHPRALQVSDNLRVVRMLQSIAEGSMESNGGGGRRNVTAPDEELA